MIKLKSFLNEGMDKQFANDIGKRYPKANDIVDGLNVNKKSPIPNLSSIQSSLTDYYVLDGIREVPMNDFPGLTGKSYDVRGTDHIKHLTQQIQLSKQITPLIVVIDEEGPYILEGWHRSEALFLLHAKSFPAIVVIDTEITRRLSEVKLNEKFNLPSKLENLCDKLAKFLSSMFSKSFQEVGDIYHAGLTSRYRKESEDLFESVISNSTTPWGLSCRKVVSKTNEFPITILHVLGNYKTATDGLLLHDTIRNTFDEIVIVLNREAFIKDFEKSYGELYDTIKHEVRHWTQLNDEIGLPKKKVWDMSQDILGYYKNPISPKNFPNLKYSRGQAAHHMRDIEFKTNLYTYSFWIKRYLNKNFTYNEWKPILQRMVTGKLAKTKTSRDSDSRIDEIIENLGHMMQNDVIRWKQFVKELYKLVL